MSASERDKTPQKLTKVLYSFLGGVLGGVITVLVISFILIDQPFNASSTIIVDSTDSRQGKNSLRWEFIVQPERKYFFSRRTLMGCFAHLEVCPDAEGNLEGIDLRRFKGLKFFAKSTAEFLSTGFNLFVGPNYIQYLYVKAPVVISTKWQEFYIDLNEFVLASWDKKYKAHLLSNEPYLSNITAFGLDITTQSSPIFGKIWIDHIRVVGYDNKEISIADCEDITSLFQGKTMRWISHYWSLADF